MACHQFGLLGKIKVLEYAKHGRDVPAQRARTGRTRSGSTCPGDVQQLLIDKEIDFWVIDALAVADEAGMGSRINTVMQPCFFQLAGVLPPDEAIARIKGFVEKTYAKRGEAVVERNFAAIDRSLAAPRPRDARSGRQRPPGDRRRRARRRARLRGPRHARG